MKLRLNVLRLFGKKKVTKDRSQPIYQQTISLLNSQKLPHTCNRQVPLAQKRNILVTSALPYVNNKPHLGNIIGAVLSADVYARYARLMGHNVLYICGTDEYGTASEVKALREKTSPKQICDQYHEIHKKIYDWFDISFDYFGRTSRDIHSTITQQIFQDVYTSGLITQKESSQLHCSHCDLFLADRFVEGTCKKCQAKTRGDQCQACSTIFNDLQAQLQGLQCMICKTRPISRKTNHLYLKLGDQIENLKKWLFQKEGINGWTNNAKGITKGWFNGEIIDRCITRDLKWGVQVPLKDFEKKVFYVWFEAPLGYISITADFLGEDYKKWWKDEGGPQVELKQFMGKDNVLFHSIICPATLLGTKSNWILPSQLVASEYLLYEGGKFSKSHNIGIFGDQCIETGIPSQCWRYYLLRVRPQFFDSEFSWSDFAQKCNKELLNSIGNLIQRVLKYSYNNYGKAVLPLSQKDLGQVEEEWLQDLDIRIAKFKKYMENSQFWQGLNAVLQISFAINEYIGKTQFWKNPRQREILGFLIRVIKIYSVLLAPFVPTLTAKINFTLGCSSRLENGSLIFEGGVKRALLSCLEDSVQLKEPIPLVKAISEQQVEQFRRTYGTYQKQS